MTETTTRRKLLAGAGATLLAGLAGCSGLTPFVGKREEYTERYDAADALEVECETGEVRVRTAERTDIEVGVVEESSSLNANLDALTLETERADGTLTLRSAYTGDTGPLSGRPSMDLDIALPADTAVERVKTTTGRVDVRGTSGDLDVAVETGSVDVRNVAGVVSVESETGSVTLRGNDTTGDVTTETGSIDADVNALDGETEVRAETGRIELALAPSLDAELDVRVETGRIDVEGVDLQNRSQSMGRLTGTLGEGGPTLSAASETGSIDLVAADE